MYEKIEKCPSCGHEEYTNFIICKDYTVTKDSFVIVECKKCHLRYTNPRPIESELGKYYESKEYISHTNKSNNPINTIYKIARHFTLKGKLKLVNKYTTTKQTLLDIGCGTGEFLHTCQKDGWEVKGIEPSEGAKNQAINLVGESIFNSLQDIENQKFDTITMWHSLEHVPDISNTIKRIKTLLKEKGRLIIAVPNCNSYDALHYKEHWAAYDLPRHLFHFTQSSMAQFMGLNQMKITNTIPMKLDAYYVSMLSEKYKTNSNRYLNYIINGYKSNSYAKKNKGEYSSLIYVIKKKK